MTPSLGLTWAPQIILAFLALAINVLQAAGPSNESNLRPRFELRFQNELDNSTIIIKETEQQQIFKCQVKLAPISASNANQQIVLLSSGNERWSSFDSQHRLNTSWSVVTDQRILNETQHTANNKWPSLLNVTLIIDWLKDGQPLEESSISVINVTLKSNQQQQQAKFDKINKQQSSGVGGGGGGGGQRRARIEIKNTLNGQQHKLTSRLKLTKLKLADSGRYKCQARATYKQISSSANNQDESLKLLSVDQSLDSSGAFLVIGTKSNANGFPRRKEANEEPASQVFQTNGRLELGGNHAMHFGAACKLLAVERRPPRLPPRSGVKKTSSKAGKQVAFATGSRLTCGC